MLVEFSEDKEQMDGKILFYPNYPISYNWVLVNNDYLAEQERYSISGLHAPGIKL